MNTPLKPVRMVILKGASLIGTTQKKRKESLIRGRNIPALGVLLSTNIHSWKMVQRDQIQSNLLLPSTKSRVKCIQEREKEKEKGDPTLLQPSQVSPDRPPLLQCLSLSSLVYQPPNKEGDNRAQIRL